MLYESSMTAVLKPAPSPSLPSLLGTTLFPELVHQLESFIVSRKPPPPIAKPWKIPLLWEVLPLVLDIIEPLSQGRDLDVDLSLADLRLLHGRICRMRELICEGMEGLETLAVEDRLALERDFLGDLWEVDYMSEHLGRCTIVQWAKWRVRG
ncbi:hypothetical protein BXZ70DRAFT_386082 [Cristinia sonorae]|uniref:Uncharacterized protein n=1 Tax=Cristinia sonorae TaxID=1940300 RepID=A0A8K0XMH1_9AGAR|nr:hypothetical protein BXZ70DRAFT_386082 [Cristinia sonorae]